MRQSELEAIERIKQAERLAQRNAERKQKYDQDCNVCNVIISVGTVLAIGGIALFLRMTGVL